MQKQEDERDIQRPDLDIALIPRKHFNGFDEARRRQVEPLVRFRGRGAGTSGISAGKEVAPLSQVGIVRCWAVAR